MTDRACEGEEGRSGGKRGGVGGRGKRGEEWGEEGKEGRSGDLSMCARNGSRSHVSKHIGNGGCSDH